MQGGLIEYKYFSLHQRERLEFHMLKEKDLARHQHQIIMRLYITSSLTGNVQNV